MKQRSTIPPFMSMRDLATANRREVGAFGAAVAAPLLIGVTPPDDWKLIYWIYCTAPSIASLILFMILLCKGRRK